MKSGKFFLVTLFPEPDNKGQGTFSLSRDGDANFFSSDSSCEMTVALRHARVVQATALGIFVGGYEDERYVNTDHGTRYQEWFLRYETP